MGRSGSKLESEGDNTGDAPCPAKRASWKRPSPSVAHLCGHDAPSPSPRRGSSDVPRTFPINAPPPSAAPALYSQLQTSGCDCRCGAGRSSKTEPRGGGHTHNKTSGEEISGDQTQRGSHPALDSQRSLCSRCLLIQRRAAFKGCGGDSGAQGQPCRRNPWQLGSHLRVPAIKKEV